MYQSQTKKISERSNVAMNNQDPVYYMNPEKILNGLIFYLRILLQNFHTLPF